MNERFSIEIYIHSFKDLVHLFAKQNTNIFILIRFLKFPSLKINVDKELEQYLYSDPSTDDIPINLGKRCVFELPVPFFAQSLQEHPLSIRLAVQLKHSPASRYLVLGEATVPCRHLLHKKVQSNRYLLVDAAGNPVVRVLLTVTLSQPSGGERFISSIEHENNPIPSEPSHGSPFRSEYKPPALFYHSMSEKRPSLINFSQTRPSLPFKPSLLSPSSFHHSLPVSNNKTTHFPSPSESSLYDSHHLKMEDLDYSKKEPEEEENHLHLKPEKEDKKEKEPPQESFLENSLLQSGFLQNQKVIDLLIGELRAIKKKISTTLPEEKEATPSPKKPKKKVRKRKKKRIDCKKLIKNISNNANSRNFKTIQSPRIIFHTKTSQAPNNKITPEKRKLAKKRNPSSFSSFLKKQKATPSPLTRAKEVTKKEIIPKNVVKKKKKLAKSESEQSEKSSYFEEDFESISVDSFASSLSDNEANTNSNKSDDIEEIISESIQSIEESLECVESIDSIEDHIEMLSAGTIESEPEQSSSPEEEHSESETTVEEESSKDQSVIETSVNSSGIGYSKDDNNSASDSIIEEIDDFGEVQESDEIYDDFF